MDTLKISKNNTINNTSMNFTKEIVLNESINFMDSQTPSVHSGSEDENATFFISKNLRLIKPLIRLSFQNKTDLYSHKIKHDSVINKHLYENYVSDEEPSRVEELDLNDKYLTFLNVSFSLTYFYNFE